MLIFADKCVKKLKLWLIMSSNGGIDMITRYLKVKWQTAV